MKRYIDEFGEPTEVKKCKCGNRLGLQSTHDKCWFCGQIEREIRYEKDNWSH
jgi:hypothetical protein